MTGKPLGPRQLFSRLAPVAAVVLGLVTAGPVACTDTTEDLFDPNEKIGPLEPVQAPGIGGSSGISLSDPPPIATGGAMNGTTPGPVAAAGGSAGAGTSRPSGSTRADAGPVEPDDGDAGAVRPIPGADDGSCGAQCGYAGGRCSQGVCFFDCRANGSCSTQQVICPVGVPCDITCGDRACTSNVICHRGSSCDIRCIGERSCGSEVICEGDCNLTCSGQNSCPGGTGGAVQHLNLRCTGRQSCGSTVQCEGDTCEVACTGQQSCGRVKIFGSTNTLTCTGQNSCGTDVSCNGTRCDVRCVDDACRNDVKCEAVSCRVGEIED